MRATCLAAPAALLAAGAVWPAGATTPHLRVTVSAPNRDYRETPVVASIRAPRGARSVTMTLDGQPVPAQGRRVSPDADEVQVAFIVSGLRKGESREYLLTWHRRAARPEPGGVLATRTGNNVSITVDGAPFTVYDTTTGPTKPYFHPLLAPGGQRLTRQWPMAEVPGESRDHVHQRGLWFAHGSVNGVDFWTETGQRGKTVHTRYHEVISGPVFGGFRSATDWVGPDGRRVATDERVVTVFRTTTGRIMDFALVLRASEGPLRLGDTKEGTFAVRVADTMRVRGGANLGRIEASTGLRDAAAWGKRAAWVDYHGPVDGQTVGIAIFDHPDNLRHPTYWHVRDYGLFAANPFGLHDFDRSLPSGAGEVSLPAGGVMAFRYRLYLRAGTTAEADVAGMWAAYIDPPTVSVAPYRR
ncbi:MAG TPA: PmoA family protein [Chthonomonadales bacterium]|nr:PmoA family protein [Chthonomonadales bacterium]